MKGKIQTINIAIKDLKPHPKNPKKHWEEGIKESIKEFGYLPSIVIDEDNTILLGHGRWKALQELGYDAIQVIQKTGLSKKEKEKLMLIDNQTTIKGGYDQELLKAFGLEQLLETGFGEEELTAMWDDVLTVDDDGFNATKEASKIKKPAIKTGERYQLGNHFIMCGDSTKEEDVKKLMGGGLADMCISDPPYNIGLNYDTGITTTSTKYRKNFPDLKFKGVNDNKKTGEYKLFLDATIKNAIKVLKGNSHIFYWCDENYIWLLQTLYKENGIRNERVCLWIKNNFNMNPQKAFNKVFEPCVYGSIGKPHLNKSYQNLNELLNKEIEQGNQVIDEILDIINIWLVRRDPAQEYAHPTQKPITLLEKPIKRCTRPGDVVIDLFGGSGSTLMACEQANRKAYLMEIDPIFVEVIIKRWEIFTNKKAKLC